MPGGFNATEFLARKFGEKFSTWWFRVLMRPWTPQPNFPKEIILNAGVEMDSYAVARYQQWVMYPNSTCRGRYYLLSCIFGVDDLPTLVKRHELIAHKLYLDFQPAAFLCLVKEIRQRSLHPVPFTAAGYDSLPNGPV
ncbi:hypothetical protein Aduo_000200 [Ancylostoma duodenale]